jgi:Uma2 family endonuclease
LEKTAKETNSNVVTARTASHATDKPQFDDDFKDTLLNPQLIIEVLSESTERYDRGRKFDLYPRIPSLSAHVIVAQNQPRVLIFARQAEKAWLMTEYSDLEARVTLETPTCEIAMAETYRRISFT